MAKHPDEQRLELLQGTLDMLILRTLQWGPQHGHGIGQAIRARSDDLLKVETGSLYPALHRLVKRGWLKAEWGVSEANQRAKYYRLTRRARRSCSREQDRWSQLVDAIGRVMNPAPTRRGVARCAPTSDDLDDEIRGHLAISIKERIERGEDPEAARLAALKEFGNVTLTRESMRRVWRHRWLDVAEALGRDIRIASPLAAARQGPRRHRRRHARARHRRQRRHLQRRPRRAAAPAGQSRRGSADLHPPERAGHRRREHDVLGAGDRTTCKSRVTTIGAFGDFSTVDFTMIGLGAEPRMVKAGVVGGSFFDVMGLRPVLGRLLNAQDDGPKAAGAAVLTYRFWTHVAQQRPDA